MTSYLVLDVIRCIHDSFMPARLSLQGKPRREAEADIADVLSACGHFASLAEVSNIISDHNHNAILLSLMTYLCVHLRSKTNIRTRLWTMEPAASSRLVSSTSLSELLPQSPRGIILSSWQCGK